MGCVAYDDSLSRRLRPTYRQMQMWGTAPWGLHDKITANLISLGTTSLLPYFISGSWPRMFKPHNTSNN